METINLLHRTRVWETLRKGSARSLQDSDKPRFGGTVDGGDSGGGESMGEGVGRARIFRGRGLEGVFGKERGARLRWLNDGGRGDYL